MFELEKMKSRKLKCFQRNSRVDEAQPSLQSDQAQSEQCKQGTGTYTYHNLETSQLKLKTLKKHLKPCQ